MSHKIIEFNLKFGYINEWEAREHTWHQFYYLKLEYWRKLLTFSLFYILFYQNLYFFSLDVNALKQWMFSLCCATVIIFLRLYNKYFNSNKVWQVQQLRWKLSYFPPTLLCRQIYERFRCDHFFKKMYINNKNNHFISFGKYKSLSPVVFKWKYLSVF